MSSSQQKSSKCTGSVVSTTITNKYFWDVMLTKYITKDSDSLLCAVIYKLTDNNKFAVSIRNNKVALSFEFKEVCSNGMPR